MVSMRGGSRRPMLRGWPPLSFEGELSRTRPFIVLKTPLGPPVLLLGTTNRLVVAVGADVSLVRSAGLISTEARWPAVAAALVVKSGLPCV